MANGLHATDRAVLRVSGPDARDFLQGLVTNDVRRLDEGPVYAALLPPQGKYLFDFFLVPEEQLVYDEKDFAKHVAKDEAKPLLAKFREVLSATNPFDGASIEQTIKTFVETEGIKPGQIAQPVRVAVTGRSVSPGLYDCLAILGRDSSLARIDRALAKAS